MVTQLHSKTEGRSYKLDRREETAELRKVQTGCFYMLRLCVYVTLLRFRL